MPESQLTQPRKTSLEQAAYRYFLEYRDEHGRLLGDEPVMSSEFDRAIYTTFFEGLRHRAFRDYDPVLEAARIEPRFVETDGREEETDLRSAGFSVAVPTPDGNEYRLDFPVTYLEARANRHKLQLVRSEKLPSDAVLRYRLTAFLDDLETARQPQAIQLGAATVAVNIGQGPDKRPGSEPWDGPEETDLPVVIARSLLEDAVEETRDHPEHEIGGFLLGHVNRGPSGGLSLEVTGLVSAHGTTETTATTVTFTPESFARAREMIALRGAQEIIVGHFHSHPFRVCSACPLPMPPECVSKILFFSQDDVDLMTTTFAQPYMVGLLCAVEPRLEGVLGHLPVRLYGWRLGQLVARGFHVLAEA